MSNTRTFRAPNIIALGLVLSLGLVVTLSIRQSHASSSDERSRHIGLTLEERVAYQRAIEEVYWRHRIWPKENQRPKPSLNEVMSVSQIREKVEGYLRKSQALENYSHRPITLEQLQAEMNRTAAYTRQPEVLREIYAALANDPFIIAECLVRPVLVERLLTSNDPDEAIHSEKMPPATADLALEWKTPAWHEYRLPEINAAASICTPDTWTATNIIGTPNTTTFFQPSAVWTGSEMIIWTGSNFEAGDTRDAARIYNPSTDTWHAASKVGAPSPRFSNTSIALWTGTEMIVWGGQDINSEVLKTDTGGRYNPSTDTWIATNTLGAPSARFNHAMVWTGSQMIVWGGDTSVFAPRTPLNTGGVYNPSTNVWSATTTTGVPAARRRHTAVWTGTEMIVWGGTDGTEHVVNTGGRYNPLSNTWTPTSTVGAPSARWLQVAIWTGNQMIVWGGWGGVEQNTGGKYNPSTDSWVPTSTAAGAPSARANATAVWTGSEMIVWGGQECGSSGCFVNTGGRYSPSTDTWMLNSTTGAPSGRIWYPVVWTGSEMIVWGGLDNDGVSVKTGGRYCAQVASPTLILEQSGPGPNQAAALDSVLFLRDPFPVVNPANLLNQGVDRNTRVIVFVTNLQLAQGETPSSVVVNLIDSNNQSYDIASEDVRPVPNFDFTQVIFRLPNNLPVGTCTIKVNAHGQVSNPGTLRIRI